MKHLALKGRRFMTIVFEGEGEMDVYSCIEEKNGRGDIGNLSKRTSGESILTVGRVMFWREWLLKGREQSFLELRSKEVLPLNSGNRCLCLRPVPCLRVLFGFLQATSLPIGQEFPRSSLCIWLLTMLHFPRNWEGSELGQTHMDVFSGLSSLGVARLCCVHVSAWEVAEGFCFVGVWVNMQGGYPEVRAKGYLKFRMELGMKSWTGQTEGGGWEPGGLGLLNASCQISW